MRSRKKKEDVFKYTYTRKGFFRRTAASKLLQFFFFWQALQAQLFFLR